MQRATPYEAGKWKCEVREYVTRWNIFANPRTVSTLFDIEIRNKVVQYKPLIESSLVNLVVTTNY